MLEKPMRGISWANKAGNQILFGFKFEFWPFASLGWYCISMRAAFIFWSNLCFHKQEKQRFEFLPLWSISQIKFGFWTWSLRAEMNSNIIAVSSCGQLEFEFWTWSLGSEINSNIIAEAPRCLTWIRGLKCECAPCRWIKWLNSSPRSGAVWGSHGLLWPSKMCPENSLLEKLDRNGSSEMAISTKH